MNEHASQCAVISWSRYMVAQYPGLGLLYAIPNGSMYGADRRMATIQARKMRTEGLRPGIPDLCLPVARHGFHALYIEMKHGNNKPSPEQVEIIDLLNEAGNKAVVCYSADEAIMTLEEYLTEESDK